MSGPDDEDENPQSWDHLFQGGKAAPKNPKRSARRKYNRRRRNLAHALEQAEIATDQLLAQPGRTHKRAEAEELLQKIRELKQARALQGLEDPPISQAASDHILDKLTSGEGWTPPSDRDDRIAELKELLASLERNKDAT